MGIETNSTNNNRNEEESKGSAVILFLSFSILLACICKIIFSRILKNKIPLPFTIAVLILGFIIGIIITEIKNTNNNFSIGEIQLSQIDPYLIYYIFLPLLIFDSSFNGHFHVIKQQLLSAILMAGPGVLISTVVIAICAVYMFPYNWSWLLGTLFGSILSATDPVAVVALLHDSGASKALASLIDSESLLNDGSAFVLFLIFRNIIIGEDHNAKNIIINIVKYSIGGPAFGLACGIISVIILNGINNELEVEITFTFALAYLIFYIADVELGVSAVLALVAMGLYMSKYKYCISNNVQSSMASAWRLATYFINILIFTITGLILARSFIGTATTITAKDFGFSIVLYIIIHIGRMLTVGILYPLIKCTGVHLSWKDCIILVCSGLRGSMALILVLIVSLDKNIDIVIRDRFLFHVSMIVLLTLVINGTGSKFLVKILGLHHGTKESETVLLQALEHMRRQTSWKLSTMKQDEKFAGVDWRMLNQYLPDQLLEELDQENHTNLHQQLSTIIHENSSISSRRSSRQSNSINYELQIIPTIYQTNSMPSSPIPSNRFSRNSDTVLPIINTRYNDNIHNQNIRNVLVTRFLTATSIDYEKQWYLGMIRRSTLNILIKSVEEAKQKNSFQLHWQLIVKHFRLTILLRFLMKFNYFNFMNRWINQFFFDHMFRTIELALSFHSAKTRLDNIRLQFPELSNINGRIMKEVCNEVKMYQLNAMHILLDLQQSYPLCWTVQMTRRCAQMLLKYESVAIIQLYETGMLEENEYSHILELIENKLFSLEYGRIKMPENQKKILEDPFDLIPYFESLSLNEKNQWKSLMMSKHKWFQPGALLLGRHQRVWTAYLIVRGMVQCKDDTIPTNYKCGSIIGIEALFSEKSLSYGAYAANDGLVETYLIDSALLNLLLSDETISRSIYNEIALHMIMNNYRKSINLTHSQLIILLNEKVSFYKNQSDLTIDLESNQKLFLLSGTIICYSNEEETIFDSTQFILINSPTTYKLNSSSIVYIWTQEDEIYCLNVKKFKINITNENFRVDSIEPFYPLYLGESTEFSPRRSSLSITRPIENLSNFQLIPSEIGISNEEHTPAEFF
ncbi:unnamed protein product [Rotaria sordida]|uniref:Cation/H+ exchanger transmembrane domain-containing protein n=1 Tax=Rotaria sordida TaxID=392033 RepID=A0A814KAB4_9BILA|nr:unnamed protein product [Rotaria sordida]CAF1066994.1 unnamed protein product [Rotaria sordida]CAF1406861.1 unnamed protein product [Rotaria sordida]CAF3738433.1 unnamed protein product [Rotaria sordida]